MCVSCTTPPAFARTRARTPQVIAGKTMGEWLRFSVAFWHTFKGDGSDPFGAPTKARARTHNSGIMKSGYDDADTA
jgi:xylose isomerase